jgi:hypothetical protein
LVGTRAPAFLGMSDDPAELAFLRQRARAPGPTGSCVIDKDQALSFSWKRADELRTVGLPRAEAAAVGDLSVMLCGAISARPPICVDIESKGKRARLAHG